jgi:hypothetical protein
METEQQKKPAETSPVAKVLLALIIMGAFAWYFYGGGLDQQASADLSKIQNQVATDALAQYQIAKKGGDATQICVQAGIVSAALLQAKNEESYVKWQQVQKADCAKAGMPQ